MAHEGIATEGVTRWFAENLAEAKPPLAFDLIAGGHSNMTFKVTDREGGAYVLRRPPLHHVLPTAHDMTREYRVITALGPTPVPVPRTYGLCTDADVNGASFYVMSYVEGHVMHDVSVALKEYDEAQRRAIGESFIDVLADLHAVDPDAVGLSDFGRKEGYVERQLKRWHSQWDQSKTRELSLVDEIHDELKANIPEQASASVVHGDYRLGNCMSHLDGSGIAAVLDWEICTLGDPLADVGYLLSNWSEAADATPNPMAPSVAPGFPSRAEVIERYRARSGRDLSSVNYYIAFSLWKLACISEGVYARYLGGATGAQAAAPQLDGFKVQVERLVERSRDALNQS